LLAGAEEGVLEPPNMFDGAAVDVVLLGCCAFEAKLNKLVAGAVAVAFPVP
jgi:hypothetical protein